MENFLTGFCFFFFVYSAGPFTFFSVGYLFVAVAQVELFFFYFTLAKCIEFN